MDDVFHRIHDEAKAEYVIDPILGEAKDRKSFQLGSR
jgi:hypothetical protein